MAKESNYHEFDASVIDAAIATVQDHSESAGAAIAQRQPVADLADSGEMFVAAECISVTIANKQICLKIPQPVNKNICLPVPGWIPNGTAAEACIGICTKFGVPTGVKVTVSVAGKVIIQKTWGIC